MGEFGFGRRVDQGPEPGPASDLGERVRKLRRSRLEVAFLPGQRQRQEVKLALPSGELHLDRREEVRAALGAGNLRPRIERDTLDMPVFGGEPALVGEIGGEHVALELPRRNALRDRAPALRQHQGHKVGERLGRGLVPGRRLRLLGKHEPEIAVRGKRQQIGQLADRREGGSPRHLDRHPAFELAEIELHRLRGTRQIEQRTGSSRHHARADRRGSCGCADRGTTWSPRPKAADDLRTAIMRRIQFRIDEVSLLLPLDVDRLVAVDRVHDRRQVEMLRVGAREAAVAVGRPLHGRAHAVAVAEEDSCRPCRARRRSR